MKAALFSFFVLALFVAGCTPSIVIRPAVPDALYTASQTVAKTPELVPAGADRHFIQADDFFITEESLDNEDYLDTYIAKMQTAPSEATKNQGQFFRVIDGKSVWSKYYAKTRIATPADLVVGKIVYYCGVQDDDGNKRAPLSNQECRRHNWFKSRITDTSELYRNIILTASGDRVNMNALRVEIP